MKLGGGKGGGWGRPLGTGIGVGGAYPPAAAWEGRGKVEKGLGEEAGGDWGSAKRTAHGGGALVFGGGGAAGWERAAGSETGCLGGRSRLRLTHVMLGPQEMVAQSISGGEDSLLTDLVLALAKSAAKVTRLVR